MVASADVDMHCPPRILWSTSRSQGPTGVIGLIHLGSMTIYIYLYDTRAGMYLALFQDI